MAPWAHIGPKPKDSSQSEGSPRLLGAAGAWRTARESHRFGRHEPAEPRIPNACIIQSVQSCSCPGIALLRLPRLGWGPKPTRAQGRDAFIGRVLVSDFGVERKPFLET